MESTAATRHATHVPATSFDIMSPELAADPWPILHALRAQGPVVWHETYRRWMVTTDRETRTVLNNPARFTLEGTSSAALFGDQAFISLDDRRRHNALRLVWADAFRPAGLARLRHEIAAIAADLLAPVVARLAAGEAVDVADALCRRLPTTVITRMMGVPPEMMEAVVRWSDAMAGGGPAYGTADAAADRERAKAEFAAYLIGLLHARRDGTGDDLISLLACAPVAQAMPDEHLVQNLRQLLFAGNETTAKWLGHIFVSFGERPALQRRLAADPGLIAAANEEVLRWQGPVNTLVRRVRGGDIALGGVTLRDGDDVTCLIGAANRDPARYHDPDALDAARDPATAGPHLGFGSGLHHCLGIHLARMEAEILLTRFLRAVPAFRLAAPYRYTVLPMRGPLPVTVAAAVAG